MTMLGDIPEVGERWVESCGWWRQVTRICRDTFDDVSISYVVFRGNNRFYWQCPFEAWKAWAISTHAVLASPPEHDHA